jgi:hypothetical protein
MNDIIEAKDTVVQFEVPHVCLPIETNVKGKQTFIIDMDEYELDETGTKQKNGLPVFYMKFKVTK